MMTESLVLYEIASYNLGTFPEGQEELVLTMGMFPIFSGQGKSQNVVCHSQKVFHFGFHLIKA